MIRPLFGLEPTRCCCDCHETAWTVLGGAELPPGPARPVGATTATWRWVLAGVAV
jgi:hypothetical protein